MDIKRAAGAVTAWVFAVIFGLLGLGLSLGTESIWPGAVALVLAALAAPPGRSILEEKTGFVLKTRPLIFTCLALIVVMLMVTGFAGQKLEQCRAAEAQQATEAKIKQAMQAKIAKFKAN